MNTREHKFNFSATGIGSVPFFEVEETCRRIIRNTPEVPFWPQFVNRDCHEDMVIQYSEGLPLLDIIEEKRSLQVSDTQDRENALVEFYDHFLSQDLDHFAISREFAPGLYWLIENVERDESGYIKGQTVGPITFAAGISDLNGNAVLHNSELFEAFTQGLAIKALWQVKKLASTGRKTIIFLDEPYLSGFGSAFTSIQRQDVIQILRTVTDYLKGNSDTLVGIHCCGNSDWPMILDTHIDIVNFDAFEFMDHFLLYPNEISDFLEKGGSIAWGIVPTTGLTLELTASELFERLEKGLNNLSKKGIDAGILASGSLITPACGMGTMNPKLAERGIDLLSELKSMCVSG